MASISDIKKLMKVIDSGEAILICGAAISMPVFPAVARLTKVLTKSDVAEGKDLRETADNYIKQKNRESLYKELKEQYGAQTSSSAQNLASLLGWKYIITTNYDAGLFYAHGKTRNQTPEVITTDNEFIAWESRGFENSRKTIIQHHGSVLRSSDTFIISNQDYKEINNNRKKIIQHINELVNSHPIFMIGYGLSEEYIIKNLIGSRDKNTSKRGYYILFTDYETKLENPEFGVLTNILNSANIEIVREKGAALFLEKLIKLDDELYDTAVQKSILQDEGLKSYQIAMHYDTRTVVFGDELSVVQALQNGELPTKTFYYNIAGSHAWISLCEDDRYVYQQSLTLLKNGTATELADVILQNGEFIPDIVCLGAGDGVKEGYIVQEVLRSSGDKTKESKLYVYLIDISPPLLGRAFKELGNRTQQSENVEVKCICTEFEKLSSNTNLLDNRKNNCFIMLGNTFGNFSNTRKLVADIKESCRSGDLLILELSLYGEIHDGYLDNIDEAYDIPPMKDYLMTPLEVSNIQADASEVHVRIFNREKIVSSSLKGKTPDEIEVRGYFRPSTDRYVGSVRLPKNADCKIFTSKRFHRAKFLESMMKDGFKYEVEFCEKELTNFLVFRYVGK